MKGKDFPSPGALVEAITRIGERPEVFVDMAIVSRKLEQQGLALNFGLLVAIGTCAVAKDGGPLFEVKHHDGRVLIKNTAKAIIPDETESTLRAMHALDASDLLRSEIRRWAGCYECKRCSELNAPGKKRPILLPPPAAENMRGATKAKVRLRPTPPPAVPEIAVKFEKE